MSDGSESLPIDNRPSQSETSPVPIPPGYDGNGVSLYYKEDEYDDPLSFKQRFEGFSGISRVLKLGTVHDLRFTTRFMDTGLEV